MTIATSFPAGSPEFDICIVGAGPAGLAVALQCEAQGLSCLVIEAGGRKPRRTRTPIQAEILNAHRHDPLHVTTRQSFGGTSWAWGGHCVPFDEIDFERRAYVPHSGWPIGRDDLARWHQAAATYLDCGSSEFQLPAPGWTGLDGLNVEAVERKSRRRNLALAYADRIERSRNIWLCLNKTVVGLDLDADGERVVGLRIAGPAGSLPVPRARAYVLAGGGLRNTHLLLNLQRDWPRHFGGDGGPLGRYYMGHICGEIATIVFNAEKDAADFLHETDLLGAMTLRHFRLAEERQRSEQLLNTAFALRSPPLADCRHGSGALSLIMLGLSLPPMRKRLRSNRLRSAISNGSGVNLRGHLTNVLNNPALTAAELRTIIQRKLRLGTGDPVLLRNRSGRYGLRYHAEQVPNPESRVRLARGLDRSGLPHLSINFRFMEADARSVIRAHEVLNAALRASGRGHLEYWHPPQERTDAVLAQALDGYHQVGTTRMRASPREGVVDADCRVHGLGNLFVASSSVFPTTGSANPTFPLAALAFRLAHHLSDRSRQVASSAALTA